MQNFKRSTEDFNTFLKQTDKERDRTRQNVIYSHLYNIINLDIENYLFTHIKPATMRPIYKKAQEIVKL